MSRSIQQRYEAHHRDGSRYGYTFGASERLNLFRTALADANAILDLGCRDGTLAGRLSIGDRTVGLDIDLVALGRAQEHLPRVVQANLWSGLPIRSECVDAVLAGEFLEHCPDPWFVAREIARVLVASGRVVGSVPNASRLKNRIRFLLGAPVELDRTHLHSFTPATLRDCLSEAGFDVAVTYCESRFLRLHPKLMANTMVFIGRKRSAK
jgi:SAM-dependent methyltransferase